MVYSVNNRIAALIWESGDLCDHRLYIIHNFLPARDVLPVELTDALDNISNIYIYIFIRPSLFSLGAQWHFVCASGSFH